MIENILNEIIILELKERPKTIIRCIIGHGNYVFKLDYEKIKYIIRLNEKIEEYKKTIYWIDKLKNNEIPVPEIICEGNYKGYAYIILEYIDGKELSEVYSKLTEYDKKKIAKQIVAIQNKVAELPQNNRYGSIEIYGDNSGTETWKAYIIESLEKSKERIRENGIFEYKKVDRLLEKLSKYNEYFKNIKPRAFR